MELALINSKSCVFYNFLYSYSFIFFFLSLLTDCPGTDIAFLLDGSGSVQPWDFDTMKNFVINMVQGLKDRNFQVSAEISLFQNLYQNSKRKQICLSVF